MHAPYLSEIGDGCSYLVFMQVALIVFSQWIVLTRYETLTAKRFPYWLTDLPSVPPKQHCPPSVCRRVWLVQICSRGGPVQSHYLKKRPITQWLRGSLKSFSFFQFPFREWAESRAMWQLANPTLGIQGLREVKRVKFSLIAMLPKMEAIWSVGKTRLNYQYRWDMDLSARQEGIHFLRLLQKSFSNKLAPKILRTPQIQILQVSSVIRSSSWHLLYHSLSHLNLI